MENLPIISIKVSGIESSENKITLLEQVEGKQYPTKYSFFQTKQDGTQSKAYTQFLSMGVVAGGTYSIAVKETEGINKVSGKPVKYRNIAYFSTGGQQSATSPQKPQGGATESQIEALESRIAAGFAKRDEQIRQLNELVFKLQGMIQGLLPPQAPDNSEIKPDEVLGEDGMPLKF